MTSKDKWVSLEQEVISKAIAQKKSLAVAESCTGGLIANLLTNISGASKVFVGGVVAYSNEMKEKILGVNADLLKSHGAVSEECAIAMVRGLKKLTNADFCVAVTGIAGPTGGTEDKPVGTVHIAFLIHEQLFHKKYFFDFPREQFKQMTASVVLKKFLQNL